ncbi:MAG: patatin-like phospholipase family protein [Candidatus Methylomirabilales bacterium]
MGQRIVDLVLQGGGIRAVAHVGGLEALELAHIDIRNIAAVSAAAFVGVAVAAGYNAAELKGVVYETDFSKFAGPVLYRARKKKTSSRLRGAKLFKEHFVFSRLRTNKGLDDGQTVMDWTSDLLKNKGVSPYATFADLPKDLRLIAYNHTRESELVFSRERTPHSSVVEAVRASTGLVPIYQPFKWTDEHGRVYELTDGGVINPYPIDIFNTDKDKRGLPPTIGLKLAEGWGESSDGEMSGNQSGDVPEDETDDEKGEESFFEYLISHITKSIDTQGKYILRRSEWRRSINIYIGNIRTVDFLTIGDDLEKKTWLMEQGNRAVQEYIDYVDRFLFLAEPLHSLFFEIRNVGKYVRHKFG